MHIYSSAVLLLPLYILYSAAPRPMPCNVASDPSSQRENGTTEISNFHRERHTGGQNDQEEGIIGMPNMPPMRSGVELVDILVLSSLSVTHAPHEAPPPL